MLPTRAYTVARKIASSMATTITTAICYLPPYVLCGRPLFVSYLRLGNIDLVRHTWAILSLLVKALRQH